VIDYDMLRHVGVVWVGFSNVRHGLGQVWNFPCSDTARLRRRPRVRTSCKSRSMGGVMLTALLTHGETCRVSKTLESPKTDIV